MRIITTGRLNEFMEQHPDAKLWLKNFKVVVSNAIWNSFGELKQDFPSSDTVSTNATKDIRMVLDVKGNKYRMITHINFEYQILYLKAFWTHTEYSKINLKTHVF